MKMKKDVKLTIIRLRSDLRIYMCMVHVRVCVCTYNSVHVPVFANHG